MDKLTNEIQELIKIQNTNLNTEEISSYLNFGNDIEKAKIYLSNIRKNYSKGKLSSFSPKEVRDLVKLLDKLN